MSEVNFEGDTKREIYYTSRKVLGEPEVPPMLTALLKIGIVKNQKQGFYFILGVAILSVIVALTLLYFVFGFGGGRVIPYTNRSVEQKKQIPARERYYIEGRDKYKNL